MARVLLDSASPIGTRMAGPGIRYWELAKALSKQHEVMLLVPQDSQIPNSHFTVIKKAKSLRSYLPQADACISMTISHSDALFAKMHGVTLILDAYDPMPFESLERFKEASMRIRKRMQEAVSDQLNVSIRMADFILCANDNQRDLLSGILLSQKKITPEAYDLDPTLKQQIGIVPFGLPSEPPIHTGEGLKQRFKLNEDDKVILWGGGIWNWFDPLTLIKAMKWIINQRSDVYLVFMGVQLPNGTEVLSMADQAKKLANDLHLLNKQVFFNEKWIPYEERTGFLLEADIGISTHLDHLETRYAFRTRLLDYIWAGLPIIATEGDSFSRLIKEKGIGLTVPAEDEIALGRAVIELLDSPERMQEMKKHLIAVREDFYWDQIVRPIHERLAVNLAKSKISRLRVLKEVLESVCHTRGLLFPFKWITHKVKEIL